MKKPTIILAAPYLYGLDICIEENLRYLGFDVINLCYDDRDTVYPNLYSRLKTLWHKKISKDGDYKKSLKYAAYLNDIDAKLSALQGKADYALCIRANIYPKAIIAKIREHSRICVNYQWDGISKFPDILQYCNYFDRFFVFDPHDVTAYPEHGFIPTTNFYFDFPLQTAVSHNGRAYFLGGHDARRAPQLNACCQAAAEAGLASDIYLYCPANHRTDYQKADIHFLDRSSVLAFKENLQKTAVCSIVLDFPLNDHQGLSFRAFDALGFDKKLITSNPDIKNYDFYHPNNILIVENNDFSQLRHFLQQPYQPIAAEIKQQYSFSAWLSRILNTESSHGS